MHATDYPDAPAQRSAAAALVGCGVSSDKAGGGAGKPGQQLAGWGGQRRAGAPPAPLHACVSACRQRRSPSEHKQRRGCTASPACGVRLPSRLCRPLTPCTSISHPFGSPPP